MEATLWIALSLSLGGCAEMANGGDPDPDCAQGACDEAAMCRKDNECSGGMLCVDRSCKPAFPGRFTLQLLEMAGPLFTASGGSWDPLATTFAEEPADAYVLARLNGDEVLMTEPFTNRGSGKLRQETDLDIEPDSELSFEVYDEDVGPDDLMLACELMLNVAELGDLRCFGERGGHVSAWLLRVEHE